MGGSGGGYSDWTGTTRSATGNSPSGAPNRKQSPDGQGGRVQGADPCDIREQAVLRSPNPVAVAGISVGDPVTITIATVGGAEVLVAEAKGVRLGVVDAVNEATLVDCMKAGNVYGGVIVQKQGGAVSVAIQRT